MECMLFIKLRVPSLHVTLFCVLLVDEMAGHGKNPILRDSQIVPFSSDLFQTEKSKLFVDHPYQGLVLVS